MSLPQKFCLDIRNPHKIGFFDNVAFPVSEKAFIVYAELLTPPALLKAWIRKRSLNNELTMALLN